MKLKYVILYVDSVEETARFYSQAFGLEVDFMVPGNDYCQMKTGNTVLSFSSRSLMNQLGKNPAYPDSSAPAFEIAFETEDVARTLKQALDAGAKLVQDVREEQWGQTTSYVSDPNGYLVEICSPVSSQS
ncbi:VOC family protein [Desulfonatronospira sp.]|uniref:VOC family protein n=1 Tax=Desulfonatronospira sp. TaxID=1962951 RepID=UPI0025C5E267|nr:VOC family protein [Desulfonatronospira sp.]